MMIETAMRFAGSASDGDAETVAAVMKNLQRFVGPSHQGLIL